MKKGFFIFFTIISTLYGKPKERLVKGNSLEPGFWYLAKELKEPKLCEKIYEFTYGFTFSSRTYYRSKCFQSLAILTKNHKLCSNVMDASGENLDNGGVSFKDCNEKVNDQIAFKLEESSGFIQVEIILPFLGFREKHLAFYFKRKPGVKILPDAKIPELTAEEVTEYKNKWFEFYLDVRNYPKFKELALNLPEYDEKGQKSGYTPLPEISDSMIFDIIHFIDRDIYTPTVHRNTKKQTLNISKPELTSPKPKIETFTRNGKCIIKGFRFILLAGKNPTDIAIHQKCLEQIERYKKMNVGLIPHSRECQKWCEKKEGRAVNFVCPSEINTKEDNFLTFEIECTN